MTGRVLYRLTNVLLALFLLGMSSVLTINSMFSGHELVYTQDSFLRIMPDPKDPFYLWKHNYELGVPYINNGYIYYYLFQNFLLRIGLSIHWAEATYLFLLTFLSQLLFLYAVARVLEIDASQPSWLFAVLASVLYLFNAYSFTVSFYLIENWTAYSLIVPLLFLVLHEIVYNKWNKFKRDYFMFLMVVSFFNYGYQSVFLVASLIVAVLFIIIAGFLKRGRVKEIFKKIVVSLAVLLLPSLGYLIAQEITTGLQIFLPNILYNPERLLWFMKYESSTTSLMNVFTFQGFVWLNMPYLFPWYYNPLSRTFAMLLAVFGWVLILAIFFFYRFVGNKNHVYTTYLAIVLISLFLVFVMKTLQPPFGEVLYYLVQTHIPIFYIFINPYYFIGQWLVFAYSFLILVGFYFSLRIAKNRIFKSLSLIVFLFFIILSGTFWANLLITENVYPSPVTKGNTVMYVNSVDIPADLFKLNEILGQKGYRALLLPPSSSPPTIYWTFNNRTVVDAGNFRSAVFTFPLISGDIAQQALSFVVGGQTYSLVSLMRYYGIKFVILNGYDLVDLENNHVSLSSLTNFFESSNFFEVMYAGDSIKAYMLKDNVSAPVFIPSTILMATNYSDSLVGIHLPSGDYTVKPNSIFASATYAYLLYKGNYLAVIENSTLMKNINYPKGSFVPLDILTKSFINPQITRQINEGFSEIGQVNTSSSIVTMLFNLNFSDSGYQSWKELFFNVKRGSIELQLYSNYLKGSGGISLMYFQKNESSPEGWATNVNYQAKSNHGSYKILVSLTPIGLDVFLLDETSRSLYFDTLPLEGSGLMVEGTITVSANFINSSGSLSYAEIPLSTYNIHTTAVVLDVKQMNPTEYIVNVNATGPFMLAFLESYDSSWSATVYNNNRPVEKINSLRLNGDINGFWIDQSGLLRIKIDYGPQKLYYYGSVVLGATLPIASMCFVWFLLREKRAIKSARGEYSFV